MPNATVNCLHSPTHAAWLEMLRHLQPTTSMFDALASTGLRLQVMPNAEAVLNQPDSRWVLHYETALSKILQQQRKQGIPQNGVFYTPPRIIHYLIERSLGSTLQTLHQQLQNTTDSTHAAHLLQQAQSIRLIDPACGTGGFLIDAFHALQQFYQEAAALWPSLALHNAALYIITYQLYGIDIDATALAIAEARLIQALHHNITPSLESPSPTITFSPQASNLYHGDTLTEPSEPIAQSERLRLKAAQYEQHPSIQALKTSPWQPPNNWRHAFPEISHWDFIVGNPPYVSEVRKQAKRFRDIQKNSAYYQSKMDLCDAFLAWSITHLKPGGEFAYILPEYWSQRASTQALRKQLWNEGEIQELWIFPETTLFKTAPGHHSALLFWKKTDAIETSSKIEMQNNYCRSIQFSIGKSIDDLQKEHLQEGCVWLDSQSGKILVGDALDIQLLERLAKQPSLFLSPHIQQGLVIPQGRLRASDRPKLPEALQGTLPEHSGIFLLTQDEQTALPWQVEERALLKPYYSPNDFKAFQGFQSKTAPEHIIYSDAHQRHEITKHPERYPRLRAHLDRFAPINTSAFAPYGLHRPRQAHWFEDTQKIMGLRQVFAPCFAVVPHSAYVNEAFYIIRGNAANIADPHTIVALLNSSLAAFLFYKQKRKGHRLQIDKDVLRHFPAPNPMTAHQQAELSQLAQQLAHAHDTTDSNQSTDCLERLNALVNTLYELTEAEKDHIQQAQEATRHKPKRTEA